MRTQLVMALWLSTALLCFGQTPEFDWSVPLPKDLKSVVWTDLKIGDSSEDFTLFGYTKLKLVMASMESDQPQEDSKKVKIVSGKEATGGQLVYAPVVYIAKLSKSGITDVQKHFVKLSDVYPTEIPESQDYVLKERAFSDPVITRDQSTSWNDLVSMYPDIFKPGRGNMEIKEILPSSSYSATVLNYQTDKYEFDIIGGEWIRKESKPKEIRMDIGDVSVRQPKKVVLTDVERSQAIVPVDDFGTGRFDIYLKKIIYTVNADGSISNRVDLTLEYPKELDMIKGFGTKGDSSSSFSDGAILVYGRAPILAKKNNDLDYTRNYVVILDKSGNPVYKDWFYVGSDRSELQSLMSFKKNEEITVYGRVSGDSAFHALMTFNGNGLKDVKTYRPNELRSKTITNNEDEAMKNRLHRSYSKYKTFDLKDGSTLLVAEVQVKDSEKLPLEPGQTEQRVVEFFKYPADLVVHIDAGGNLTGYYVADKQNLRTSTFLNFVGEFDDYLVFKNEGIESYVTINLKSSSMKSFQLDGVTVLVGDQRCIYSVRKIVTEDISYFDGKMVTSEQLAFTRHLFE